MPPMIMQHDEDPREKIFKKVGLTKAGTIPGFELLGNRVLLGVYERPNVTKTGIHLADVTRAEDQHQGKAAVVLMKGASAFVSDDYYDFHGENVAVGDWVSLWVSDGRRIVINGQLCRIIRDQDINMKIPAPDSVF
jgi:co-chaperonin GroES (HSP10)